MPIPTAPDIKSGTTYRRTDLHTFVYCIPHAPLVDSAASPATVLKPGFILCTLEEFPQITYSAINEETVQLIGKQPVTVNSGFTADKIQLRLQGNAVKTIAAMRGRNPLIAGQSSQIHGEILDETCSIIILAYNAKEDKIEASTVLGYCKMEITEWAGAQQGATPQTVTIWSDKPTNMTLPYPFVPAFEVWYNPSAGGIVNAAAIGATINLGSGNNSLAAATTDYTAWQHDSSKTAAAQYFCAMIKRAAGEAVAEPLDMDAQTFVPGTPTTGPVGVVTLATALANDDYTVFIYPVNVTESPRTDTTPAGWRTDLDRHIGANLLGGSRQSGSAFIG